MTEASAKAVVGGSGAVAAITKPSEYVSYFDRIYDLVLFEISGDDLSRSVGVMVGLLVGSNIIYNVVKDYTQRKKEKR